MFVPVDVVLGIPFVYLAEAKTKFPKWLQIAAQNASSVPDSAPLTGEVSPAMLRDLAIPWVILGHSERRALFGETSQVRKLVHDNTVTRLIFG